MNSICAYGDLCEASAAVCAAEIESGEYIACENLAVSIVGGVVLECFEEATSEFDGELDIDFFGSGCLAFEC